MNDALFSSYVFITLLSASFILVYFPKVKFPRTLCFSIYLLLNLLSIFIILVFRHEVNRSYHDWMAYIAIFTLFGVTMVLLSDGSLIEKLVIYTMCANAMLLTMMTAMSFAVALFEGNYICNIVTVIVFHILFEFIPLPAYRRKFREITLANDSSWRVLLSTLLLLFCFTAVVVTLFSLYRPEPFFAFVILLILLFIFYSVCMMAWKLIILFRREAEHKVEDIDRKIISSRLRLYEEAEEISRMERHDIRHHLRVLGEFASKGDLEGLSRYLELDGIMTSSVKHYSEDRAIDNAISAYSRIAGDAGCTIDVSVNLDNGISGISDQDMTVIIANLLENAIAGTCRSKRNEHVTLSITGRGAHLAFRCTNPSRSDVIFTDGIPTENGLPGTGIISIRNVAAKYSGDIRYSLINGVMEADIVLNRVK